MWVGLHPTPLLIAKAEGVVWNVENDGNNSNNNKNDNDNDNYIDYDYEYLSPTKAV